MTNRTLYVLNKRGEPEKAGKTLNSFLRAMASFGRKNHVVKLTKFRNPSTKVSTVFLGFDHNFSGKGGPVLWETMVFSTDEGLDSLQQRCGGSREQAESMHDDMVKHVTEKIGTTQ